MILCINVLFQPIFFYLTTTVPSIGPLYTIQICILRTGKIKTWDEQKIYDPFFIPPHLFLNNEIIGKYVRSFVQKSFLIYLILYVFYTIIYSHILIQFIINSCFILSCNTLVILVFFLLPVVFFLNFFFFLGCVTSTSLEILALYTYQNSDERFIKPKF